MNALFLAIAAVMLPFAAGAAELPAPFLGTWRIALPADNTCRAIERDYAIEGHMIVKPGEVLNYEQSCRVVAVKMLRPTQGDNADAEVAFACEGEGKRWSARAVWHTTVIDGKKVVAVTSLGQSNWRNAKSRKEKMPSQVITSIYLKCAP